VQFIRAAAVLYSPVVHGNALLKPLGDWETGQPTPTRRYTRRLEMLSGGGSASTGLDREFSAIEWGDVPRAKWFSRSTHSQHGRAGVATFEVAIPVLVIPGLGGSPLAQI